MATAPDGAGRLRLRRDRTRRGRRGNIVGARPSGRQRRFGFHELGARDLESQLGARIGCSHRRSQHEVGIRIEAEPIEHRPLCRLRLVESAPRGVSSEALAGAVVGLERRLVGGLEIGPVGCVEPSGVRGSSGLLDFEPARPRRARRRRRGLGARASRSASQGSPTSPRPRRRRLRDRPRRRGSTDSSTASMTAASSCSTSGVSLASARASTARSAASRGGDRGVELVLGFVEPRLRLVAPDRRCPQGCLHGVDDLERSLDLLLASVDELAVLGRDVVGGSAASDRTARTPPRGCLRARARAGAPGRLRGGRSSPGRGRARCRAPRRSPPAGCRRTALQTTPRARCRGSSRRPRRPRAAGGGRACAHRSCAARRAS